jgi:cytochrome c oxidase assembly protein subunit 15
VSDPQGYAPGLHRYATAVAAATAVLLFVGGLVTSTGSGLAVPDWPLSFGQVFPRMRGGVLFEHGHRMVAATVGLLTVILAAWLWRAEGRRWVRRLGALALVAVILQGALGGLTVLLKLPVGVSVAHAGVAEIFFCLTVTIALVTSRGWLAGPAPLPDRVHRSLRGLSLATVAVVYVQVLLGALVRHTGAGLAIPDFPLSFGRLVPPLSSDLVLFQFAHRVGAALVSGCVIWTAGHVLRRHRDRPALARPALLLLALLAWQIYLGAAIIWTRKAVVPTTTHVVSGALLLVTALVLALRVRHHGAAPAVPAAERPAGVPSPTAWPA